MKSKRPRRLTDQDREILCRIGERIKELRLETGWTPANSSIVGFKNFGIQELERGEGNPRISTLIDLCRELRTSLSELLKGIA